MKRFTETEKWKDPWFRSLTAGQKLVFIFLIENCNNAGFYEVDLGMMAFCIGIEEPKIEGALKGLTRGIEEAGGWVWLKNFLKHQKNEELNPENPAHRQIFALLREQTVRFGSVSRISDLASFQGAYMDLSRSIGNGTGKGKKGSAEGKQPKIALSKPTREEAIAYGTEIGMKPGEVEPWFDHFESNGWRVSGKTPMRDWKAALRNGNRRKHTVNGTTANQPTSRNTGHNSGVSYADRPKRPVPATDPSETHGNV